MCGNRSTGGRASTVQPTPYTLTVIVVCRQLPHLVGHPISKLWALNWICPPTLCLNWCLLIWEAFPQDFGAICTHLTQRATVRSGWKTRPGMQFAFKFNPKVFKGLRSCLCAGHSNSLTRNVSIAMTSARLDHDPNLHVWACREAVTCTGSIICSRVFSDLQPYIYCTLGSVYMWLQVGWGVPWLTMIGPIQVTASRQTHTHKFRSWFKRTHYCSSNLPKVKTWLYGPRFVHLNSIIIKGFHHTFICTVPVLAAMGLLHELCLF